MWNCPLCNQQFTNNNQAHSCSERDLADFLAGKSQHTIDLFGHLVSEFQQIGDVKIYPTKSMISFGASKRFAYVIQLGKISWMWYFLLKKPLLTTCVSVR